MKWIKCDDRMPEIDVESIEIGEPENNDILLRTFSTSNESYYYELVTPSALHDLQISEFMEWAAIPQSSTDGDNLASTLVTHLDAITQEIKRNGRKSNGPAGKLRKLLRKVLGES